MNTLEITGSVVAIKDVESGVSKSQKEWKKQTFVIETEGQYPKKVAFDTFKDDVINTLTSVVVGEKINVCFDVESHDYNGRWFTNINAYKIERTSSEQPKEKSASVAPTAQPASAKASDAPADDLPF